VLERNGRHALLDCGLYRRDAEAWNERPFPASPESVDAVVLWHAHLDHRGLLPRRVREGYRRESFSTRATAELLQITLRAAAQPPKTRWRSTALRAARSSSPAAAWATAAASVTTCATTSSGAKAGS